VKVEFLVGILQIYYILHVLRWLGVISTCDSSTRGVSLERHNIVLTPTSCASNQEPTPSLITSRKPTTWNDTLHSMLSRHAGRKRIGVRTTSNAGLASTCSCTRVPYHLVLTGTKSSWPAENRIQYVVPGPLPDFDSDGHSWLFPRPIQ
jgi:hypothetical protein